MSEQSVAARAGMKAKMARMLADNAGKVDASSWTPPEPLNTEAKTGMRPVSPRAFKRGGKVEGDAADCRSDRAPRQSGGKAIADAMVNRDDKEANKERAGTKHVGALKTGGRATKAAGGPLGGDIYGLENVHRKAGGRTGMAVETGTRPTGGREARATGGRAKGKTNINIVIAPSGGNGQPPMQQPAPMMRPPGPPPAPPMPPGPGAMPVPMPPGPGGPGGMPPMMPRKSGGRTVRMDAGAGSGVGRLEKIGKRP